MLFRHFEWMKSDLAGRYYSWHATLSRSY